MTAPTLIGPVLDEVIDHLTIVELEQHLDDEVPCIVGQQGTCSNAAEWAVRCPACGFDWHACSLHRIIADQGGYVGIRCAQTTYDPGFGCGEIIWMPLNWRPL